MFRLLLQVGETGALEWESRAIGSHPKRPRYTKSYHT